MKLAKRLTKVNPSATLAINAKTLELKRQGVKVISLAVGEPDFNTPDHIANAAKKAIDEHFTRYTDVAGIADARAGVCTYFKKNYNANTSPENIIISNGGKQSLYNLMLCLLDEGDEILIPVPYWTSYPDMALLVGASPVYVPSDSAHGFRITPDDLEKSRTAKSKVLLLNSPSNPSGVTYTQKELDALLHWAIKNDIFVIADEVYDQLVYEPAKATSASIMWQEFPDKIAVVNSLAKSFAMTGWRIGFTLAHSTLIKEMIKLQGQTTSNVCSIAQKAAVAALHGSYDCIIPMKEAFKRRRDFAYLEISSWQGVICPKPEGAFYLFPDISALFTKEIPDTSTLCTYLLEEAKVAVMPGDAFGDPKCIRISYAISDEILKESLASIKKALYK